MDRLQQRLQDHPPDTTGPLISLAEALEWLYALHHHHVGRGTPEIEQAASADGETCLGLVYARGKLVKALLDVAQLVTLPGTVITNRPGSKTIRPPVRELRWAPVRGRGGDRGEEEYKRRVEGQPVYTPLEAAARFLARLP